MKLKAKPGFCILRLAPVFAKFGGIDTSMISHDNERVQKCEVISSGTDKVKDGEFVLVNCVDIFPFNFGDEEIWMIHEDSLKATIGEFVHINETGGFSAPKGYDGL